MAPGPRLRRRSLEHHRFQVPPEEEHDDSESSGSEYSEEHWRDLSELVRAALRDGLRQPDEHAADACISCTHATRAADLHPALDGGGCNGHVPPPAWRTPSTPWICPGPR